MVMQGLTVSSLKKHPAVRTKQINWNFLFNSRVFAIKKVFRFQLIPLFLCLGVGVAASALYTLRLAAKNPDVSWNKRKTEPWEDYRNKTYKVGAMPF